MRYWMQYHDFDRIGYLPGGALNTEDPHDSADFSSMDTSAYACDGIATTKRTVLDAIDDVAFLIVGCGGERKRYLLWSWSAMEGFYGDAEQASDELTDEELDVLPELVEDAVYSTFGRGAVLNPPRLLSGLAFEAFREANADFRFGFRDISAMPFVSDLKALARESGGFDL